VLGVHRDGGMREFLCVSIDHLIPTPTLSLEQAALVEPLAIGAHAVRRAQLTAGETVLVIGAGPIGLAAMKFAKLAGAKVIAMDINEERLAFCRRFVPADHTVNALREPLAALATITGGDLPTVVFDATGNAKSMMNAFAFAAHGGKLVYVGLVKADITFHDPDFHKKELTLLSSRNATREDFQQVIRSLDMGVIDDSAYITHTCAFDQLIDRFPEWLKPETGVIKGMATI
jgi:threonine dehydrogenase-like Zn-dependent dehydrogenase